MRISVLFPHKLKNPALSTLADDYRRFASKFCAVDLVISAFRKGARTNPAVLDRVKSLDAVFLSERGRAVDTSYFVRKLSSARMSGAPPAFLVGAADGVPPDLEAACKEKVSLSPLTLPHELALVILLEQIWRALSIIEGHPYHK